jgi:hypothetical protein
MYQWVEWDAPWHPAETCTQATTVVVTPVTRRYSPAVSVALLADRSLLTQVCIKLSNARRLPSPEGWEVVLRNGRILITGLDDCSVSLDSYSRYGMLSVK